ncbi:MAG: GTPase Era [Thermodesulfovibrionales bacterium]|nr:GTPase Era [Thermodesulfovibrionales bacterium]
MKVFKSGFVAIVGPTNAGKSTLLNALVGDKVSIVSSRPQTTRQNIRGIKNLPNAQIVFVDTPGIHKPVHKLGQRMINEANESLKAVDLAILVVDSKKRTNSEIKIINTLKDTNLPVILAINKVDTIKKPLLLPIIDYFSKLHNFKEIIPISAKDGTGLQDIITSVSNYLPEGPKYFDDDIITDQYERFMVSEIIREKVMENTRQEVPHSVAVDILNWQKREDGLVSIHANILVEKEGQKIIIIGRKGAMLKKIGSEARQEIEHLIDSKVFLELWIKVRKDWREDEKMLQALGY